MAWGPALSLFHININSLNIQGNNPLISVAGEGGSYVAQSNSQQWEPDPILRAPGHSTYHRTSVTPVCRRVEAQMRVRRKLNEARVHRRSIYNIHSVAQVATDILSLVEGVSPSILSYSLIDLAMNAHAMAYIALISCLYRSEENGNSGIKEETVEKLRQLLKSIHTLLVKEVPQKGMYARIKNVLSNGKRRRQELYMQEELVDILRHIENDEDASILTSLTTALDCPYQ